ncbi:MAG: glycosyltransferase family 4 protein [Oligoflexia bacterium]|nr:glycosyltransferase family 4 protein [Oligoflexia bacterium]
MSAMGEWTWPGGYLAYGREMFATYYCDGLAAVYGEISFLDFLKRGNRPFSVIGNGWDSGAKKEVSKTEKRGHWAFVGRGLDPVKGVDLIEEIIGYDRSIRIDAIPGDGFTDNIQTRCLGKMSNEQVVEHLEKSKGLILPSYFEAMPLVILEALAFGIPVVAANVGGIRTLNSSLKGLFRLDIRDAKLWCEVINEASLQDQGQDRIERAMWNRRLLRTWNQVAQDMKSLCQAVLDQRRKTN